MASESDDDQLGSMAPDSPKNSAGHIPPPTSDLSSQNDPLSLSNLDHSGMALTSPSLMVPISSAGADRSIWP